VWERARPEELLGDVAANSHDWAPYPSFPSGHVAVTVAIVVAAARAVPLLRAPLWLYAAVIAITRITYGAHFPSDVVGGLALGIAGPFAAASLLVGLGLSVPGFRPSDHRDVRAALAPMLEPRRLLVLARVWSVASVVLFFVLLGTVGPPHGLEGGVLSNADEYALNRALLDFVGIAVAVAWFRPSVGGAAMLLLAVFIGAFARLEYSPAAAFLACLAFFVPALLYLLSSSAARSGVRRAAVALAAVTLLALGGFAGERVHAMVFGPSHPESKLRPLPPSAVEWVWAGGVTPTSVTVNAKLSRDGGAHLLVSERRSLTDAVTSTAKHAEEDGNDRTLSFSVGALTPGRRYFYAVEVGGEIDRTRLGSFRTPARGPFSFTVAFGACARTGSNGAVFDAIRAQRPLLFLLVGDFFYGNIGTDSPRRFREAYGASLTAPAQAALYRSTPVAYVWDDHDYGPNDGDRTSESRTAAQTAYRQLVPHYQLPSGPVGPIYQAFTLGRLRFVLTDLRSERSPSSERDGPGKTMLGTAQKAWLKRQLVVAQQRGQLVVWASSVPWIAGADAGADTWAGYASERRELADVITSQGPVLMLGGDAHMLAIDDGSHSGYASNGTSGFPVIHAAALDRPGGRKAGPFSEGAIAASGQFGTLQVEDDGHGPIDITLTGRRYDGSVVLRYAYSVDLERP
jgi:phosphodiesterase/alkaline phosphatase D-like protein